MTEGTTINSFLIDKLIPLYTDHFFKQPDDSDERFWHIGGYICRYILFVLYCRFINQGEAIRFEDLPQEKKEKYIRLSNIFYKDTDELQKIRAARSAYILELITSTF